MPSPSLSCRTRQTTAAGSSSRWFATEFSGKSRRANRTTGTTLLWSNSLFSKTIVPQRCRLFPAPCLAFARNGNRKRRCATCASSAKNARPAELPALGREKLRTNSKAEPLDQLNNTAQLDIGQLDIGQLNIGQLNTDQLNTDQPRSTPRQRAMAR